MELKVHFPHGCRRPRGVGPSRSHGPQCAAWDRHGQVDQFQPQHAQRVPPVLSRPPAGADRWWPWSARQLHSQQLRASRQCSEQLAGSSGCCRCSNSHPERSSHACTPHRFSGVFARVEHRRPLQYTARKRTRRAYKRVKDTDRAGNPAAWTAAGRPLSRSRAREVCAIGRRLVQESRAPRAVQAQNGLYDARSEPAI